MKIIQRVRGFFQRTDPKQVARDISSIIMPAIEQAQRSQIRDLNKRLIELERAVLDAGIPIKRYAGENGEM